MVVLEAMDLTANEAAPGSRSGYVGSLGFRVGPFNGIYKDYIGVIQGLYGDNGKENGNYYVGFRV